MAGTYNGPTTDAPGHSVGGFSQRLAVHERHVLRHRKAGPCRKAGAVGIGGLRHVRIKLARALGACGRRIR
jgi:uncharacterized zinc-type alcohol dehydrogenase-like protein